MKLKDILDDDPLTALHMYKRKKKQAVRKSKTGTLTWDPFGGMTGYPSGYKGKNRNALYGDY